MADFITIVTVLNDPWMRVRSIVGHDILGDVSEHIVNIVTRFPIADPKALLGTNATVGIEQGNGKLHYINGYVTSIESGGRIVSSYYEDGGKGVAHQYEVTLHSWLWLSDRTANCRIFQHKKVVDILAELFEKRAFAQVDASGLKGAYRTWDYCVQYHETDRQFFTRMTRLEGIAWYVRHENGRHTLVLTDNNNAFPIADGYATMSCGKGFVHTDGDAWTPDWRGSHTIVPGQLDLNDFNPERPFDDITARHVIPGAHKFGDLRQYDFGTYPERGDGQNYARIRLEAARALGSVFTGTTSARGIGAGNRFTLQNHRKSRFNKEYLIIESRWTAANPEPGSGAGGAEFTSDLTAIPADTPFRLPPAEKPHIDGPQTATVVGPKGEEIYTDSFARVKVKFHWDRFGTTDENSSCWLRVVQPAAGKRHGALQIPRIGHLVTVEFLGGDPDLPLITGGAYDGLNTAAYDFPADKTQSGTRSKTYKSVGFNEFSFDDATGKEKIYLHAERDHELRIKNDRREDIGGESRLAVDKNQHEIICGESHLEVVSDRKVKIGASEHVDVAGDQNIRLGGAFSLTVGEDWIVKAGTSMAGEAAKDIYIKAGTNLVFEGGASLTLKAAGSFVNIGAGGVFLSGPMVYLNSGGAAGDGRAVTPAAPLPPTASKGKDKKGVKGAYGKKPEKPPGSGKQVTMLKLVKGESFVEQVAGGVGALVAKAAAAEETAEAFAVRVAAAEKRKTEEREENVAKQNANVARLEKEKETLGKDLERLTQAAQAQSGARTQKALDKEGVDLRRAARVLKKTKGELKKAVRGAGIAQLRLADNGAHAKDAGGEYAIYKDANSIAGLSEADHMPSGGALKKKAEAILMKMGVWGKLDPPERKALLDRICRNAPTILLPDEVHKEGRTYKTKNTPKQIKADSENLKKALESDAAATRKVLDESYPGLVAKYDESVEMMRQFNYDKLIQDTINEDKNVIKKTQK